MMNFLITGCAIATIIIGFWLAIEARMDDGSGGPEPRGKRDPGPTDPR